MIVVVLGMHRSGTSLISSMLHAMGVRMGEPIHLERNDPESQPHGYWEDQDFTSLNRLIIKEAGGHWHAPPSKDRILTAARSFDGEMGDLVKRKEILLQRVNEASLALEDRELFIGWGWKDPRNCLTMEAWWPHLVDSDLRLVRVRRSVEGVIDSLIRRGERLGNVDLSKQREGWKRVITDHENRISNFIIRSGVADVTIDVEYERLVTRAEYLVPLTRMAVLLGLEGRAYTDGLRTGAARIEFRG